MSPEFKQSRAGVGTCKATEFQDTWDQKVEHFNAGHLCLHWQPLNYETNPRLPFALPSGQLVLSFATHAIAITNRKRLAITTLKSLVFPAEIAIKSPQKSHWAKKIVAIRNHSLVVATCSVRFPYLCGTAEKSHRTGGSRVQRLGFRGCFRSRNEFFGVAIAIASGS